MTTKYGYEVCPHHGLRIRWEIGIAKCPVCGHVPKFDKPGKQTIEIRGQDGYRYTREAIIAAYLMGRDDEEE